MARKKRDPELEEEIIYVSKSEIKREVQELHKLGMDLAALSPKARQKVPLNEELEAAMLLADKLSKKKESYRRHLNYIAKQLRLASDLEAIKKAMDVIGNKNQQASVILNKLEHTRDQIIELGDEKINELLEQYDNLDRQKLRQLTRLAKKEVEQEKPAKGYRELFQYLKESILKS
ncbi:ribosome biogenesis factor YjgA [Pseudoalteromonas denitrificans]|uniref:Dual-action ribosomal maturation protein DarP n=1 Tax=Pseudoalteromonas denitrificans DSM 6059 TaxID=1123010 RepID=A0A1I1RDC3_9GAMM|nr:ribosome biogenesis factor YjgA [Pseudoalteromonas denitrificans]SFD30138.1 ribosome-associated protein [Pseudoalteromonas denitrificans DSM 6059]